MLSFIIPSYNYVCTKLVQDLYAQASALKQKLQGDFDFEIIVGDDCSTEKGMLALNRTIEAMPECRVLALSHNVGRAHICNYLVKNIHYDYFVLIDCDALVCTDDFVEKYWTLRDSADVVCGSLRNLGVCPKGGELRYFYEKAAEKFRTVDFRRSQPYTYFTTFNVLFHRAVFERLQFDERCTEYGYEDALMGLMLEKEGFQVSHIDNPLIHNGIDASAVYLQKIETSLHVLHKLGEPLHSASALVRLQRKLKKYGLLPLFKCFYRLFSCLLKKNLLGSRPSMNLLKIYKLGYYSCLK